MKKLPLLQRILNRVGLMTRSQMMAQVVGYQSAAINRLTASWTASTLSADSTIRKDLPTLRARSRQLVENNDYARAFIAMVKSNVIGEHGVLLKNKARDLPSRNQPQPPLDTFANRQIEDHWWEWNRRGQCTVDRTICGADLQNLAMETVARDGEVLLRKVRGFDNDQDYAVQILESDYLDTELNKKLTGGNEIRMGVEVNKWREPIAYWLLKRNPNDNYYEGGGHTDNYETVPARDIIHAFIKFRPEQTRGVPWMATAMYRLNMVGKYEEAETTAARAAASKMAFLTKTNGNAQYTGESDGGTGKIMDAEPGAIEELPFGMDLKVLDWNHPNSSYSVFMKTALRGVASGLGVSYNTLANDMESVNFASGKLGLEAERECWKAIQRWFIDSVLNEIFKDWLEVQLMNQTIPLPFSKYDKFNSPDWRPRRWSYINPQQEVAARIQEVNAGFTSISRVLAERGLDRDEIFDEIQDDMAAAEARDIHFSEVALEDPVEDEKELIEAQQAAMPAAKPEPADRSAELGLASIQSTERSMSKMADAATEQSRAMTLLAQKLAEPVKPEPIPAAPPLHQTITLDTKATKQTVDVIRDERGMPLRYEVTRE